MNEHWSKKKSIKNQNKNYGQWNYLSEVNLLSDGNISIMLSDSAAGIVTADAFRIIYKGEPTGAKEITIPETIVLYQNYPNPFNPTTTIRFELKEHSNVKLRIFNPLGELVELLVDEELSNGLHEIKFDASGFASGIYYYQIIAGKFSQTKSMVILK